MNRYIQAQVVQDLKKKMVFVGGPRQVGKTTLAKGLLGKSSAGYLNWDVAEQRERILLHQLPNSAMWVFDEIHKYSAWRDYLKGVYDQFSQDKQILVTGSARLDFYRRGGDSLQGRYHYLRLHPLSIAELGITSIAESEKLLELGGFPEPYFSNDKIEAKRWSRSYRQRLIQEDLVSLERVQDLGKLELLMLRLPALVGSPLSLNALREDLKVSHKTIASWLSIFENLYAIYRLSPFGSVQLRAVQKEQKHFHYDWTLVEDAGARFENFVASHLLKWVHFEEDTQARELELRYFRDRDGREVDFIITENQQPLIAIECKLSDADVSKHLKYFKNKFPNCRALQLSMLGEKDYLSKEGIEVCNAVNFLSSLV